MEHEVVIRLRIILDIVPSTALPVPVVSATQAEDMRAVGQRMVVDKPLPTKTEVIRVCEPETAPRPLRHIKKVHPLQEAAEWNNPLPESVYLDRNGDVQDKPVPSAAEVQAAFAKKWETLGGTSVQTLRLKGLLAQYGETDHTKVSPENRTAFLHALEAME